MNASIALFGGEPRGKGPRRYLAARLTRWQFGSDFLQGPIGLGGHQHTFALGEEVGDEGRGSMSLAGFRRALHQSLG